VITPGWPVADELGSTAVVAGAPESVVIVARTPTRRGQGAVAPVGPIMRLDHDQAAAIRARHAIERALTAP
jgi:hypothetical protein